LFLQETAHLLSLLSAVALSTLRNDMECVESPITEYHVGQEWPAVDSYFLDHQTRASYGEKSIFWTIVYYLFGISRSNKHRTMYNAARPFGVLGGVSDEEIRLLQSARGPYAKVALVSMWLEEFISREYLHGSTGSVAAPIISRLYVLISDGAVAYNQARKIACVPFPFPTAQIASFFSLAIMFLFPLLYDEYVNRYWFAAVMNFTTVLCFLGLHEVARELESPFINVPNDLPLTTFQAQLNEALVTMYAGYHPDSWWEVIPDTKCDANLHSNDDKNASPAATTTTTTITPADTTTTTTIP
jgi:Bestrophin, RFP-TM, chloride channel